MGRERERGGNRAKDWTAKTIVKNGTLKSLKRNA